MEEKEIVKGFFFMRQYYETFRMLPDADRLKLLDALLAYAFEGEEPGEDCSILIRVALNGMKTTVNGSIKMHQARSEAGKRGGAPKGNHNACRDETSKNKQIQAETSEKEKEKEKEKEIETEINISADEAAGVYKKNSYSADFEQFYKAYPRHTNKQDAFKAYCKAIKKAPPGALLEALETQKAGEWKKIEDRFIPYPATWLNRGAWENEASAVLGRSYNYDYEENSL